MHSWSQVAKEALETGVTLEETFAAQHIETTNENRKGELQIDD